MPDFWQYDINIIKKKKPMDWGGGDLPRHFDLQPISAKKGGGWKLAGGALSMNSTVIVHSPKNSTESLLRHIVLGCVQSTVRVR